MSGLLDAVIAAQDKASGYLPETVARAAVEAVAAWLDLSTAYQSSTIARLLRAEVAPPTPDLDLIVKWMTDGKATGTTEGDAQQLLDMLRDAGMLRDTP